MSGYRWVQYGTDTDYEMLLRPDGTALATLTEPEDRVSYRDLDAIAPELNRLLRAQMTLPHCTGCTEPGAVTHQQETVEHIHDACNATIAALREALVGYQVDDLGDDHGHIYRYCRMCGTTSDAYDFQHGTLCPLAQPIPPAAAKLLAERDAGRALFRAVEGVPVVNDTVRRAIEAYRKVVEG